MDLVHLRAFATVARLLNFTRAAERLNLTQPTISGQIRALEAAVGVELFHRDSKSVRLTAEGTLLLPLAEDVLFASDRFLGRARSLSASPLEDFRLGFILNAKLLKIGQFLSRLRDTAPNLRVEIKQGLSGWILANLRNETIDAGYYIGLDLPADFAGVELTRITYQVAAPAAWGARLEHATWQDLARMPWIWTPETGSYPHIVRDMFAGSGVLPTQIIEADREETISELVVSGVGVCILREALAQQIARDKRIVLWPPGRREVPLYFLSLQSRRHDPAIETVRKAILADWTGGATESAL